MKLVIDERLKHRLIGLAVIISLAAIFAPAIMKKSSQRLDNNFSVHVTLPAKPPAPDVGLTGENEVFKTIKVAKVKLPPVNENRQLTELVKAAPLHEDISSANTVSAPIEPAVKLPPVQVVLNEDAHAAVNNKAVKASVAQAVQHSVTATLKNKSLPTKMATNTKVPALSKKVIYAVQLASFTQINNAQALVQKLQQKGYKANFVKSAGKQGAIYKVFVGHSTNRPAVMRLKTELAAAIQLNGLVVNTGVS